MEIKIPKLKINGEIVHPERPKAKVWREVMKFDEAEKSFSDADLMVGYAKKNCNCFRK